MINVKSLKFDAAKDLLDYVSGSKPVSPVKTS